MSVNAIDSISYVVLFGLRSTKRGYVRTISLRAFVFELRSERVKGDSRVTRNPSYTSYNLIKCGRSDGDSDSKMKRLNARFLFVF